MWELTEFRRLCEALAPFGSDPAWREARRQDAERLAYLTGGTEGLTFLQGQLDSWCRRELALLKQEEE